MVLSKFQELLMPPEVSFPADETELFADLSLVFSYGLSVGVIKPEYGKRLLRSLAVKDSWLWDLLAKAAGHRDLTLTDILNREWGEFEEMANAVEESLPLD